MNSEIKNAVITNVKLTMENCSALTAWLDISYGNTGQSFGGYYLYTQNCKKDLTGLFIWRIMETVGVEEWNDLVGKTIRVKYQPINKNIEAIGNIMEDKWFSPSKEFRNRD